MGVLVNSPANPTGWVMTADDQRALLESCRERGIYVIADEVYIRLAYNAPRAPSFLDIAEPDDRLLAINSFSKSWSMTGWRLGWLTHAPELGDAFAKLNEYNVASPTTFVQHAGITAIGEGEPFVESLLERYRRNRDLVVQRLGAMRRVRLPRPDGAFYAFFAVDGVSDSLALAHELIASAGVGLAPGRAFRRGGRRPAQALLRRRARYALARPGPAGAAFELSDRPLGPRNNVSRARPSGSRCCDCGAAALRRARASPCPNPSHRGKRPSWKRLPFARPRRCRAASR